MIKLSCVVLALVVASSAFAHKPIWKHELNGGLTLTDGNSETTLLNVGAKSEAKLTKGRFLAEARYRYGSDQDQTSLDKTEADLESNRDVTERSYLLLNSSFRRDTRADLDGRLLIGPGVGVQLLEGEKEKLNLELATVWRYEELAGERSDSFAARISQQFEYGFGNGAKLWQKLEVVAAVDDVDDFDSEFSLGAEAPLVEKLFLRTELINRYDARPAEGKEENDLTFATGFSYKF